MTDLNEQLRAELLSCPMCGGTAQPMETNGGHMVMCHDCGVNYEGPTTEDCTTAWNRRQHGSAAQAVAKPYGWVYDDGHNEPRLSFKQMPSVLRGWTETPVFAAPPVADAKGAKWVDEWMGRNDVVLKQSAYRELCAALSRRPAAEQPAAEQAKAAHVSWRNEKDGRPAAAGNALTDEQKELARQEFEGWMRKNAPNTTLARSTEGYLADRVEELWRDFLANECSHLRAAPQAASTQDLVRFCPHCGLIGDVGDEYRDCCPDGNGAFMVPPKFAEQCRATFRLCLETATAPQAAQGEGLTVALVRAAEFLEHYVGYIYDVKPADIERHPYIPSIQEVAEELRAIAAHTRASDGEDGERLEQMRREEYASYCEAVGRHGVKPYTFNEYRAKAIEKIDAAMQQAASNSAQGGA